MVYTDAPLFCLCSFLTKEALVTKRQCFIQVAGCMATLRRLHGTQVTCVGARGEEPVPEISTRRIITTKQIEVSSVMQRSRKALLGVTSCTRYKLTIIWQTNLTNCCRTKDSHTVTHTTKVIDLKLCFRFTQIHLM